MTTAPITIHYCSDIHTEFGALDKTLPGGDILLLAGDILVIAAWKGEKAYKDIKKRGTEFIEDCVRKYKRVFMVCGNHEYYNSDFDTAMDRIRPWLSKEGVTLLQNDHVELRPNLLLFGATLWTDMDKDSSTAHYHVGRGMNDFRIIGGFSTYRAKDEHHQTLAALHGLATDNPDKTILVMTHHAPSYQGVDSSHSHSTINAGYASDMEEWIKQYPNIKYWVHGHTHIQKQYEIEQCKVFANCRGYIGYEHTARTFEIKEFTIDV